VRMHKVTAAAIAAAVVLSACGGSGTEVAAPDEAPDAMEEPGDAPDDGPAGVEGASIVVENWDAYMPDDLPERIAEERGITVEIALHATNEEAVARMQATGGQGIDVLFVSSPFAEALQGQGLLASIDHALLPNLANLYPQALETDYDPGLTYSVPYAWGTTGLCYSQERVGRELTSWSDLLDPAPELEGKITMLATDRWLLLPALKQLGFSANTVDEDELGQAQSLLVEQKSKLLAYDDTTFYSRLASGEADLVEAWDGWCNYAIAEDPDVVFTVPSEGSDHWIDVMVIPGASENVEAAHAFIDFILEPENGRWVAENILYKVPNQVAMEALDPELIEAFPNLGISPEALLEQEELRDLGAGQPTWSRIVAEITAS
jgi:spermidine/putrescine transport system substrate-binding protein